MKINKADAPRSPEFRLLNSPPGISHKFTTGVGDDRAMVTSARVRAYALPRAKGSRAHLRLARPFRRRESNLIDALLMHCGS